MKSSYGFGKYIESLIVQLGGNVRTHCVIDEIDYHVVLVELPAKAIQNIIKNPYYVDLVKCDDIMFFRPSGQIVSFNEITEEKEEKENILTFENKTLPQGDPIVAVLDGLPLSNHELLADRLIIDDPDDWVSEYRGNERKHGTQIASLIIHGDINDTEAPLKTPVYVRPIMKPDLKDTINSPRGECIPDIMVDIIHRAVKRIFESDGVESAVAPSIKIVNLSIGDPRRQFIRSMSPLARLLDWLSFKYNILFIVSAGNHSDPIQTGLNSRKELEALSIIERQNLIVKALYENSYKRRLLSPAESINSITVGSAHFDSSTISANNPDIFDPFSLLLPSPFSAFGSGYRKAIKPDVIFPGEEVYINRQDQLLILEK